jgi:hypothetical protein
MSKVTDSILRTLFNQRDGEYKLSGFWYGVFRPIGNRYYTGMKLYTIAFVIQYVPFIILLGYVVATSREKFLGLILLLIWIGVALFDFFVVRKYEERVTWKYAYNTHYENSKNTDDQAINTLMRKIDKDPTLENEEKLKNSLIIKNND